MTTAALAPDSTHTERPTAVASATTRTARYAWATTCSTFLNISFLFFTVALPVIMLVMVTGIFGSSVPDEARPAMVSVTMMNMAAYGGLTAAINAGTMIQLERANGWLRQLMVAGMTPGTFVIGKLVAAMAVALPVILAVIAVGLIMGAREDALRLLAAILLLWVMLPPMVLLGLVLGLSVRPSAVAAVSTIAMMLLAVAGGLWFPTEFFPDWLKQVSYLTPTHWLGALPYSVLSGGDLPMRGIVTVLAWTLALGIACALLLRRGARTTSRR